jgi:hypothetical protein
MVGHFPLEGDGCVSALFHYIWNKNNQKKSCPLVNVPDTVVYKYRQPAYWYFTSKDRSGGVKMKNKTNLGNANVESTFSNKSGGSASEVVAYYISSEQVPGQGMLTTIEHFDTHGLKDFLMNHDKENNGILQRFVDGKGGHNSMFRAIWSPNVFHVERRTNVNGMGDRKVNMHQRVVTFEGNEHFSESLTVTDTLLGAQMQRICECIVDHCGYHLHLQGESSRINRMVIHFKVDDNNRVWLLWCSSIRLSSQDPSASRALHDTTPIDIFNHFEVPEYIKRFLIPSSSDKKMGTSSRRPEFVCGPCYIVFPDKCPRVVDANRKCEVTYKMVMSYWEKHKADIPDDPDEVPWLEQNDEPEAPSDTPPGDDQVGASDTWGSNTNSRSDSILALAIPPVFRKLHPNMTPQNYSILKKDPLFLYSRMSVCDVCFLLFTEGHAPVLPVVDKMPSSLLMDRKTDRNEAAGRESSLSRLSTEHNYPLDNPVTPAPPSRFTKSALGMSKSLSSTDHLPRPKSIPPLDSSNPMSMGGYHYIGNAFSSKAPRKVSFSLPFCPSALLLAPSLTLLDRRRKSSFLHHCLP